MANNLVYMHYIILTLWYVTEKEDHHEFLEENDEIREMVIQLLENMSISARSRIFWDFFARSRAKVISEILLMFLTTSEKEYIQATEEPKEFMNYALDVSDKHESKTVKTQAAKWLESFWDKIDGCISFCSMFWIQSIDCYINGNQNSMEMRPNYLVLIEFFKGKFLGSKSPEIIIESCVMSLTIISYLLPKRLDILQALDFMLKRNQNSLINDSHILIQARMALFYGYFSDILFKDDEDNFKQGLEFLFKSLGNPAETQVVGMQSWETLITLIADKNIVPRLKPLVR